MKLRVFWIVVRVVFFSFIPAFFILLGGNNDIFNSLISNNILSENFNIERTKSVLLLLSVLISNLTLVLLYEIKNHSHHAMKNKVNLLFADFKAAFLSSLAMEAGDSMHSLKFRVWKEPGYLWKTLEFLKSKVTKREYRKKLIWVHVNGISDAFTPKDLEFEIYPNLQGLVGKCYSEGTILYEEDVSDRNELYGLTQFQISRTRNTKFCICFPIFNAKNKVTAVISLDSFVPIKIPQDSETKLANLIAIFVQELGKYYPKLMR